MPLSDFLTAYRGREAQMQAAPMQELQQVGALQKIAAGIQAQQQEQAFRSALSAAKTPEEQSAVAMKYGKPAEILGHLDRQTTAANTREIAIQRLTQGARDAAARLAVQERNATTAEQKAEIARGRAEVQNWYQRGVLALQAGKAAYELPPEFVPQIGNAPTGMPASSVPAVAAPIGQPQWGPMAAGTPPEVQAAAAQIRSNLAQGGPGGTIEVQPSPTPPQAAAAPVAAPTPVPAPIPAPAQVPSPAPTPVEAVPDWIGRIRSPKERQKAEAVWRIEKDKRHASADRAYMESAGKEGAKDDLEQHSAVLSAAENLVKIDSVIDHLKTSQTITGIGADLLKNVERMKVFVTNSERAGKKVSDTELLNALLGSDVFPMIKALGIGARGLDTPAEREFLREVMSGTTNLNKETLIRMTELRKNVAERAIQKWNARVTKGELDRFFAATGRTKQTIGGVAATSEIPEFATEAEAINSGFKGKVRINGRNATIK